MMKPAQELELLKLYRKFEVVLFRYFKIAYYLEQRLKFKVKSKPLEEVFKKSGYNDGIIYIPFNPFYMDNQDKFLWEKLFPEDITPKSDSSKDIRLSLCEVWRRIHFIKENIGIKENTRVRGQSLKNRLTFILERYLETGILSDHFDFTKTIFDMSSRDEIINFISFLKTKYRTDGIKSIL